MVYLLFSRNGCYCVYKSMYSIRLARLLKDLNQIIHRQTPAMTSYTQYLYRFPLFFPWTLKYLTDRAWRWEFCISSVQFTRGLQHTRPPCPSSTPRVYPNSHLLSRWCHPTISSSVGPFSFRLQLFPASGFFQMSQLFISCDQSIGVSASTSVLPMNIQDWFLLGWTGLISLQSKGLWRVVSNTIVQKHQFFGAQLSL